MCVFDDSWINQLITSEFNKYDTCDITPTICNIHRNGAFGVELIISYIRNKDMVISSIDNRYNSENVIPLDFGNTSENFDNLKLSFK